MNKTSLLLASLLGAIAINAQAGDLYEPQQYQDAPSTLTRAQVKAQVLQARRAGELNHNDVDLPGDGTLMTASDRVEFGQTRAAVKSGVLAAQARGELAHNDVDLPSVATGSVVSRQQVRADAIAASRAPKATGTIEY